MKTEQEIKARINQLKIQSNEVEDTLYGYGAVEIQLRLDIKIRTLEWVLAED